MSSLLKNSTERTCVECSTPFTQKGVRARCDACHAEYKNEIQRKKYLIENGKPGWDYIECPACLCHFGEITLAHAKKHGFSSLGEFKKAFGLASIKCGSKRDQMRGSNNPGYQHGGKLSPFSKSFVAYDGLTEEQKDQKRDSLIRTVKQSMLSGAGYNCTIDHYIKKGLSLEEATKALTERQTTFSLDICIEKHGQEDGRRIWEERQRKWLETLDSKSEEEKVEINKRKSTKVNYDTLWGGNLADPGSFYIIRIDENRTKIGITTQEHIKHRYSGVRKEDVIFFEKQENINVAFMIEQVLRRRYSERIWKDDYGQFGWTEVLNGVPIEQLLEETRYLSERPEELQNQFEQLKTR